MAAMLGPQDSKVVVIGGGAGGIGAAIARRATAAGYRCVVVDREYPIERIHDVDYVTADLTQGELSDIVMYALNRLDIAIVYSLVNCAAVASISAFADTPRNEWARVIRTNLEGTLGITQAVLPVLSRNGRIIFFSSGTVFKGPANLAAYVASKAGVIGFARSLAAELGGRGITVNVVAPGLTDTPMSVPLKLTEAQNIATRAIRRPETPDDIVGTVMFLLGSDAGFITGQTICVDGGSVRH